MNRQYIFRDEGFSFVVSEVSATMAALYQSGWIRIDADWDRPSMKISLFSDYSLRVLMYAALKGESFLLDEVTEAYGISRHHLAKVVNRLAQLGYLGTLRGRGGGIRLGQPPGAIRLGAVLRQTEDQPVFVECFNPLTNTCPVAGCCRLKGILGEALREFYTSLDRYTLADLVTGPQREAMANILLGTPQP